MIIYYQNTLFQHLYKIHAHQDLTKKNHANLYGKPEIKQKSLHSIAICTQKCKLKNFLYSSQQIFIAQ